MTKSITYSTQRWTNPQTGRSFVRGNTYEALRDAIAQAARTASHGCPCDVFRNKNARRVLCTQFRAFLNKRDGRTHKQKRTSASCTNYDLSVGDKKASSQRLQ
ncbi:hypothetical protein pqer_cds_359 [Pandoravirus quercus]|uniref:Uncharacterized protein n=1 Tax=Pandoravirus quercus TaxID=2107709 RepID=A0A2U7U8L5_9VIRU|nr:hypothetical protein pqer_cds_359 [Pandoravirus quercus]AVK74781.1 hypothetical protein pqer_cds_359 [Pandoravirus quercus]